MVRNKKYNDSAVSVYPQDDDFGASFLSALKLIVVLMIATVIILVVFFSVLSYNSTKLPERKPPNTENTVSYTEKDSKLLLRVVNTANKLEDDYVPVLTDYNGVEVNELILPSLEDMISKAQNDGVNLEVVSGYVSFDEQKAAHEKAVSDYRQNGYSQVKAEAQANKTVPDGGCSELQTGLLVSFSNNSESFKNSDQYDWLVYHAIDYGFILRYDGRESSTMNEDFTLYRFVGKDNAKKMRMLNMSLEEYNNYLSSR